MNFNFDEFVSKRRESFALAARALHCDSRDYVILSNILMVLELDLFAIASMLREWNVTIEEVRKDD